MLDIVVDQDIIVCKLLTLPCECKAVGDKHYNSYWWSAKDVPLIFVSDPIILAKALTAWLGLEVDANWLKDIHDTYWSHSVVYPCSFRLLDTEKYGAIIRYFSTLPLYSQDTDDFTTSQEWIAKIRTKYVNDIITGDVDEYVEFDLLDSLITDKTVPFITRYGILHVDVDVAPQLYHNITNVNFGTFLIDESYDNAIQYLTLMALKKRTE